MDPIRNKVSIRPFQLADGGAHTEALRGLCPAEGWSEWWYANFHDTALDCHGMLAFKIIGDPHNFLNSRVSVSFLMFGAGNHHFYEEIPADRFSAASSQCDVRAGSNFFRVEADSKYIIHLETSDRRIVVDLVLEKAAQGFTVAIADAFWAVSAPLAKAYGVITLKGGEKIVIQGHGYHDHNWGTQQEKTVSWNWGEAGDREKKVAVIFAKMAIPGVINQDVVIVSNEKGFWDSLGGAAKVEYTKMQLHERHWYPSRERVRAQTKNMRVELASTLERGHHWEQMDIFLSGYQGKALIEGKEFAVNGKGLWEYKYIREAPGLNLFLSGLKAKCVNVKGYAKSRYGSFFSGKLG